MAGRREWHPLDGVSVRISSDVRPPKAITVPSHLLKASAPASLDFEYDFSVERRVLAESQLERERQAKLATLQPTAVQTLPLAAAVTSGSGELLQPSPTTCSGASESHCSPSNSETSAATSNINLREFEPDSSTPFDHVELQAINEIEELTSIFNVMRSSNSEPPTPIAKGAKSTCSVAGNPATLLPENSKSSFDNNAAFANASATNHSVPAAASMKNLFDEEQLARVAKGIHNSAQTATPPAEYLKITPTDLTYRPHVSDDGPLRNPIKELPSNLQVLAGHLVNMGFPESRVIHAVLELGDDEARVVEHLCLLQNLLEEEGFQNCDEQDALQALLHNGGSLDAAREFLRSMCQFKDLGFDRKDISAALRSHKNNRDRALDELLSK